MNFTREEVEGLIACVRSRIYSQQKWRDRIAENPEIIVDVAAVEDKLMRLHGLYQKLTELLGQFQDAAE